MGECGSCAVSMGNKIVSSWSILAVDADGKDIITMEKLTGEPGFKPVMEAMIHPDHGALRVSSAAPGTKTTYRGLHLLPRLLSPLQRQGHRRRWPCGRYGTGPGKRPIQPAMSM